MAACHPDRCTFGHVVGASAAVTDLKALAARAAARDRPVLINGVSGTGQELFARVIHRAGHRRPSPFVRVNCAALPRELSESEIFGYEKGSSPGRAPGASPGGSRSRTWARSSWTRSGIFPSTCGPSSSGSWSPGCSSGSAVPRGGACARGDRQGRYRSFGGVAPPCESEDLQPSHGHRAMLQATGLYIDRWRMAPTVRDRRGSGSAFG